MMLILLSGCALVTGMLCLVGSGRMFTEDLPPTNLTVMQQQARAALREHAILARLERLLIRLAAIFSEIKIMPHAPGWITPWCVRAGWPYGLRPMEWLVLAILSGIAGAAVITILFFNPMASVVAGLMCAMLPFAWLQAQGKIAQRSILQQSPDFLDATALFMRAGGDFASALSRYAQAAPDAILTRCLKTAVLQMQAGTTLLQVLQELDARLDTEALRPMFAGLRHALEAGAPLAPQLSLYADVLREQWFEAAEKQAAEATIKLLFPLILIFAAVLLVVIGPLAIQMLGEF